MRYYICGRFVKRSVRYGVCKRHHKRIRANMKKIMTPEFIEMFKRRMVERLMSIEQLEALIEERRKA